MHLMMASTQLILLWMGRLCTGKRSVRWASDRQASCGLQDMGHRSRSKCSSMHVCNSIICTTCSRPHIRTLEVRRQQTQVETLCRWRLRRHISARRRTAKQRLAVPGQVGDGGQAQRILSASDDRLVANLRRVEVISMTCHAPQHFPDSTPCSRRAAWAGYSWDSTPGWSLAEPGAHPQIQLREICLA